jgi:hypothetical protein
MLGNGISFEFARDADGPGCAISDCSDAAFTQRRQFRACVGTGRVDRKQDDACQ